MIKSIWKISPFLAWTPPRKISTQKILGSHMFSSLLYKFEDRRSNVLPIGWCVENIIIHFSLKKIKSIVWNSGITYKPELLTIFLASMWRIVRVALFPNRNCIVKGIRSYSNAKAVMNNLLMSLSAYIHSVNTCVHAWFCLSIAKELTYKNLQMKMNTCISCTCEVFTSWRLRLFCVGEKTHMEWTCITTNDEVKDENELLCTPFLTIFKRIPIVRCLLILYFN